MDVVTLGMAKAATTKALNSPLQRIDRTQPAPLVASNCWAAGTVTAAAGATGTARTPHVATVDCCDLRLVYGNSYINGSFIETDGANPVTIKASVEVNGVIYRVTFGGLQTGTVDPGGKLISDPLGIEIAEGTKFYVRTYSTSAAAPQANYACYGNSGSGGWTVTTDLTAPGSAAVGQSAAYVFTVRAILGTPTARDRATVAIVGDSIGVGSNDYGDGGRASAFTGYSDTGLPAGGYIVRGLAAKYGWINIGVPSDQAALFTALNGHYRRIAHLSGCTDAIVEYGINDVSAGRTLAQIQADLTTIWNLLARRGMKVRQTTLTPKTTSTDLWSTTGGQGTYGEESVRTQLNDWIRTTPAPLVGYIEAADLAETSRNAGLWKPANRFVTDGTGTSGNLSITSATAAFTSADIGRTVLMAGAGAAGAPYSAVITGVTNAMTAVMDRAPGTTVAGSRLAIGVYTVDGTHPSGTGAKAIAPAVNAVTF
ncbi:SGNH/GDSL hydrolase family protein [Arthrobacter sp. 135MFCol5.1]|uniref:SGNH/GDSL hydrolase family protein n=1 Tax=Arthrobacter sp. 135MFCol5.1 TaxID=1158050 RepID=UPI0003689C5F|nr:SGNH/GDSL hydrolase family protein [Arthrobacter sp. 135MFCol5.1]